MFGPSNSNPVPLVIAPEDSRISVQPFNVNLIGFWIPTTRGVFYGTPVALQIDVHGLSGVGGATGTVTIYDGPTRLGSVPLTQGTAWVPLNQFLVSSLEVGAHAFSVSYSGDRSFNAVATQPVAVAIVKAFVNFARAFGETPSVTAGTPVLVHMNVLAPGTAVPSGTVELYDNGTPIAGPIVLNTNVPKGAVQADYTAILAPGSHNFRIGYSGDVHHNPVTPPSFRTPGFTVTVTQATGIPTSVQITEASPSITVGQSEDYVVTVVPSVAGRPVPTGTVKLLGSAGSSVAGPYPLTSGVAEFMVPWSRFINVGTLRLVAQYSGDGNYSPGISSEILTTVDPATPAVSLAAPSTIVRSGSLAELTVTVQPTITGANIRLPFGLVQFLDSIDGQAPQPLGAPHPLTQGNGNFTTFVLATTLPEGTHVVTAQYLGGSQWGPATSNPVKVVVRRGHHDTDDGGQ